MEEKFEEEQTEQIEQPKIEESNEIKDEYKKVYLKEKDKKLYNTITQHTFWRPHGIFSKSDFVKWGIKENEGNSFIKNYCRVAERRHGRPSKYCFQEDIIISESKEQEINKEEIGYHTDEKLV